MLKKKFINKNTFTIFVCWLVYTCSYIGKLGFNANIALIESEFGVTHAESGAVGTAFFLSYGAGQVINGIFCKKYNAGYTIFFSLLISAVCNLLITVVGNFALIKWIWLCNGAALSVLWSLLIRVLSETLDERYSSQAVVVMGTTVAAGTFAVYGLSALFVRFFVYKIIFYVAAVLLPLIACIWFFSYRSFASVKHVNTVITENTERKGRKADFAFISTIIILAFFAITTNFEKDGITVWIPAILKETYDMPDYTSILLTLCLPVVSLFGTMVAVFFNKYIKNYVILSGLFFAITVPALIINVLFMRNSVVVMLFSLSVIALFSSGINNVITSMAPLRYKYRANAGLLAGVLNGCCYIGSTLSSYGLGAVADNYGWNAVFYLLIFCSGLCCLISLINLIFNLRKTRGQKSDNVAGDR